MKRLFLLSVACLVCAAVLSTRETPCISADYDEGCEIWFGDGAAAYLGIQEVR